MILSTKSEKKLMDAIYTESLLQRGTQIMISPRDLLKKVEYSIPFNKDNLDRDIKNLQISHYFDYTMAVRDGEDVYLITLLGPGQSYEIDKKATKRRWVERLISGAMGGLASVLVKVVYELVKKMI